MRLIKYIHVDVLYGFRILKNLFYIQQAECGSLDIDIAPSACAKCVMTSFIPKYHFKAAYR